MRTATLAGVVALAAFAAAAKKAASGPQDCFVTSTWPDGRTEDRECIVLSDAAMKPGTKARFESCTR